MPIHVRAEKTNSGIILSGIASQAEAKGLCTFFRERGTAATITPISFPGDVRVLLVSLTMERFAQLIRESDIQLTP